MIPIKILKIKDYFPGFKLPRIELLESSISRNFVKNIRCFVAFSGDSNAGAEGSSTVDALFQPSRVSFHARICLWWVCLRKIVAFRGLAVGIFARSSLLTVFFFFNRRVARLIWNKVGGKGVKRVTRSNTS